MATETLAIVDRGRGPQLSTSRITVQDLLPFYRECASNDEIRRWLPSLRDDEIALLKEYIHAHFDAVLLAEQHAKTYHDRMRSAQPAWTRAQDHLSLAERQARLREKLGCRSSGNAGGDDPSR